MPTNKVDSEYDAVIIGAGIGGLVCGNYLAKAGLKTLILDQHYLVGGCCSSFARGGFTFDSGAHSLGSCREGGQFDRVLRELGLLKNIHINRAIPSDSVVTRRFAVSLGASVKADTEELQRAFPGDRSRIGDFLKEIEGFDINSPTVVGAYLLKYRRSTFKDLLDSYFSDEQLKQVFCAFLGNAGLGSRQIGALPALTMFREFVLDGGYFLNGGMGVFVQQLAESFEAFGGTLSLSNKATKIIVRNGKIEGVSTKTTERIRTSQVISNASPRQTFLELIGADNVPRQLVDKIEELRPSVSAFVVYMGVKGTGLASEKWGRTVWYSPENTFDSAYAETYQGHFDESVRTLLIAFPSRFDPTLTPPDHSSLQLFVVAPYIDQAFWKDAKDRVINRIVSRANELMPGLKERVLFAEGATPITLHRYTLNDQGAMYGLASSPSQYQTSVMPQRTCINGLLLASHWATVGAGQGGTPMAAFAGRNAARVLLQTFKGFH